MHEVRYITTRLPIGSVGCEVRIAHKEDPRFTRRCGLISGGRRLSPWTFLVTTKLDFIPEPGDRLEAGGLVLLAPVLPEHARREALGVLRG